MFQTGPMNYDRAADEYAAHRQVHPGVLQELCQWLGSARHTQAGPAPEPTVLEVGCGTGNYATALAERLGSTVYGLDASAGMLAHARARPEGVTWILGRAEQLGFAQESFDLVFSVDVIHHVADKQAFYDHAARVLRSGGQVCTVTDSEEIIRRRGILSGYFPETVEQELARYPHLLQLEAWMRAAGFAGFEVVTVELPRQLTDAQPFRDKAFSSLHLISEAAWRAGIERLEHDLAHGPIRWTSRYVLVWGRKPGLAKKQSQASGVWNERRRENQTVVRRE